MRTCPLKLIFIIFLFISINQKVTAAVLPDYSITKTGESVPIIKVKEYSYPSEITPLLAKLSSGYFYIMSSSNSQGCTSSLNMVASQDMQFASSTCPFITKNNLVSSFDSKGNAIYKAPSAVTRDGDWKHSYDGITGFQIVNNTKGTFAVALRHGETQNVKVGTNLYQSYLYPNVKASDCAAGYVNGVWQNCGASFNTFASLLVSKLSSTSQGWNYSDVTEYGPVVWPSYAMRNATTLGREYPGPYHPTLYSGIANLFIYYDNYKWDAASATGYSCISVSRAPKEDFSPSKWMNYANGDFTVPSMPSGFDWRYIDNFYALGGSPSDCINQPDKYTKDYFGVWFSVARIRNTSYYLGVEERQIPGPVWQIGTRVSTDLINWSTFKPLVSINGGWGYGTYSYPILVDKYGGDRNEIDADDFYIFGKHATNSTGYETNKMRLSMSLFIPYSNNFNDLNNDNVVDLRDLIELVKIVFK